MRGDVAVTARLLVRGTGLAGTTAVLGGAGAVVATGLPWYAATLDVGMLGAEDSRVVVTLAGIPTIAWGWGALLGGVAAVVLGAGVALDRPLPRARPGLAVVAGLLVAVGLAALTWVPDTARVAGAEATRLHDLAGRLPVGVTLELGVRRAVGPATTLVAGALVAIGALRARDQ